MQARGSWVVMKHAVWLVMALVTHAAAAPAGSAGAGARPSDAELRKMLITRVDAQHQATGIVVGLVTPEGTRVITYGTRGLDDHRPVDADTVFDVGSITKVFTSILLAELAQRGKLAIDDPVVRYLPGLQVPERNGRTITLADLATHTSGLPLRPTNLVSTDPDNRYAGYTHKHLTEFLAHYVLPRDPGADYEYSNIGYAVLGEAVAHALGQPYPDAVQARIAGPLGLRDTRLIATPAMTARAAVGYDAELKPAKHWDMGVLAPAGGLKSTARDLMRLLEAQLGIRKTPLAAALAATIATRRPGGMPPATIIALGWNLQRSGDGAHDVIWKNGSVGGYRSFVGFDPEARIGVVALANAQTAGGVDDIGLHVLDPAFPVDLHVPVPHKAIALAPAVLDRYVGRYRFSDTDILVVTRDGAQLYGESPGVGKYPLYAETERDFFLKLTDAQVSFAGSPRATEAIWHERGQDQTGKRIE